MIKKGISASMARLVAIGYLVFLSANLSFAGTVALPKTGQTTCYDTDGNVISCTGTGQDGAIQAGVEWPDPRFTDNGDGTITDNLTGLMWLKSGNCFGTKTWQEALDAVTALNASPGNYTCGGYTGTYNDWVLPNINELESLVNAEQVRTDTWLNGQGFLNVQKGNQYFSGYWSSTTVENYTYNAWIVNMPTGYVHLNHKTYNSNFVWPVRTGQAVLFDDVDTEYDSPFSSTGAIELPKTGQSTSYAAGDDGDLQRGKAWPVPRFSDNGDGTVTDKLTELMWLKDPHCFDEITWQGAFDIVSDLNSTPGDYSCGDYTAAYSDWRVPNRKEIHSLTDYSQYSPALPSGHPFLFSWSYAYWSSTTVATFAYSAWEVAMVNGTVVWEDKTHSTMQRVWPVRAGQTGSFHIPTVMTTEISSITSNSASSGGNVTSDGGADVTAKGVCWSTTANPTTNDSKTTDGSGTGSFTSSMTGLSPGTTYHVRAYATNSAGTAYGSEETFTTASSGMDFLYVSSDGTCGGNTPCYITIQEAIDASSSRNTIKISEGTYNEDILLNTPNEVTLQGGLAFTSTDKLATVESSTTTITGKMTIGGETGGTVVVDNLVLGSASSTSTKLPDTGQTKCYDNDSEITCPPSGEAFYGQDGNYTINPPSYTKLDADGNDLADSATEWVMVRDTVTGLIWEMKTDDVSIHDRDNTYNWQDARYVFVAELNSSGFGGFSDWRLPTLNEMAYIVNCGTSNPAIDASFFLNTMSSHYWSSTTLANDTSHAFYIQMSGGYDGSGYKSDSYYVRAVRGSRVKTSFVNNGDGTVTDASTGLMWQQATAGAMNWQEALSYCESLTLGGYNDWRLPNIKVFRSIVEYEKYDPAIDIYYLPDTLSSGYWSATTRFGSNSDAWIINFRYGFDSGNDGKLGSYYVRAVRGGK